MNFEYWLSNLGSKVDICYGDLVISSNGFLTVSTSLDQYALYLDRSSCTATPVIPKNDYRGRVYKLRMRDCVTLTAEWLDRNTGLKAADFVKNITRAQYINLHQSGYLHLLSSLGFVSADTSPMHGDIVVYEKQIHIGICIDGDKILHHLPGKYSSIDPLEQSKILGVYRRA